MENKTIKKVIMIVAVILLLGIIIEVAFDALKNELENDKTYLDDDDAVCGYFFISFLSLYLYSKILNLLRKSKLVDKVSVNQVLLELSKVYEIHLGEKRKLSEIPDKVMKLAESLELNIFPKKLWSYGFN